MESKQPVYPFHTEFRTLSIDFVSEDDFSNKMYDLLTKREQHYAEFVKMSKDYSESEKQVQEHLETTDDD